MLLESSKSVIFTTQFIDALCSSYGSQSFLALQISVRELQESAVLNITFSILRMLIHCAGPGLADPCLRAAAARARQLLGLAMAPAQDAA